MQNCNYEDDAEMMHSITASQLDIGCGAETKLGTKHLATLSASSLWTHGLRLIVMQPSAIWQSHHIEKVRGANLGSNDLRVVLSV